MRALVVATFDSFLRAGMRYGEALAKGGAEVDCELLHARKQQVSPAQLRAFGCPPDLRPRPMSSIATRGRLARYDAVLLSLDGLRTRRFMTRFSQMWSESDARRPIVVSMYPGLVFRFHLEGMMSRMSSDLFLLNSRHDQELYRRVLSSLGMEHDNSMVAGLPFVRFEDPKPRDRASCTILFAGQPTVPAGEAERLFALRSMVELARRYPDCSLVFKPRHRPSETTLHRVRYHYQELFDRHGADWGVPQNFRIDYTPLSELLPETDVCLTFSSTAALESLAAGVTTGILTDLGIHENIGNHFFIGSDLFVDFDEVTPDLVRTVNRTWLDEHVPSGGDALARVAERIRGLVAEQHRVGRALPIPNGRLFGRSEAYNRFLAELRGWRALEQFGDPSYKVLRNQLNRAKRRLDPLRARISEAAGRLRGRER